MDIFLKTFFLFIKKKKEKKIGIIYAILKN